MSTATLTVPAFPATAAVTRFMGRCFRGFGRFVFSRKMLYLLLALVLLVAVAWKIEDWHGNKVWQEVEADMARRGLSFDELALTPVPPAKQNFAMHPIFAPAMKPRDAAPITPQNPPMWNFGILQKHYAVDLPTPTAEAPVLAEGEANAILTATESLQAYTTGLQEASQRPTKQWCPYFVPAGSKDYMADRPVLGAQGVFEFATYVNKWLSLRAQAQLAKHELAAARATVLAMIQTGSLFHEGQNRGLVTGLVDSALQGLPMPHLAVCLARPEWRIEDLQVIADALAEVDVSAIAPAVLRYEMLYGIKQIVDPKLGNTNEPTPPWASKIYDGFFKHNAVALYHAEIEGFIDPSMQDGPVCVAAGIPCTGPHSMLAAIAMPGIGGFVENGRKAQLAKDKLRLRCLVKIYQQRTGNLPKSLDALVPTVLKSIPVNHLTGQPLALSDLL